LKWHSISFASVDLSNLHRLYGEPMAIHLFHRKLAELRRASRWPDQDDFSAELGMSLGGYKKYESGQRVPKPETLQKICMTLKLSEEEAEELWRLRDDVKAKQVGISRSFDQHSDVDPEALAKRIENEVFFILRRAGIDVPTRVSPIICNRVNMIIKNALGG
jgi:transcriptional regulator with XRE-family HTH domain